jgi:cytochrome c oxidase assembly protein subunit 15
MLKKTGNKLSLFRRLSLFTLISVYFLILVGGIVRSTGSGMGCPDWPKCFGQYIPPTSEAELPADYKAYYSEYRHQKNVRFAGLLANIGFADIGEKILEDESIREEADFNAYKTWTEYINRLIGALIGLFILATFVASVFFVKTHPKLTVYSAVLLISVGFQGWLGSIVVSTNLLPWLITSHMLVALVIVGLLVYLYFLSRKYENKIIEKPAKQSYRWLIVLLVTLMTVQIVFGTRVREAIDVVAQQLGGEMRSEWIEALGVWFYIHRSLSLIIIIAAGALVYSLWKKGHLTKGYQNFTVVLTVILVAEVLLGVIMAYFGVPPFAQPLHLLLSALILGVLIYQLLIVNWNYKKSIVA